MNRPDYVEDTWAHAAFAKIPAAPASARPNLDKISELGRSSKRRQTQVRAAAGTGGVLVLAAATVAVLTLNSQHTTVLKAASGGPSVTPSAPVVDPLCATPLATPPSRYLDWPCATPADATTPAIVAKLVASVRAGHPGIKDPQVRLLADTRGITDSYYGPSATLIEEWDAASSAPVVLAYTDSSGGSGSNFAEAGDPGMLNGSLSTDNGIQDVVLFARADIASVSLDHDGTVTSEPFTGGATAISVKAGDITIKHPSWNYVGKNAAGTTVSTIPYDSIFLATGNDDDPCAGISTGTCSSSERGLTTGTTPIPGGAPIEVPTAPATEVPSAVPASAAPGATQSPVPASAAPGSTESPSAVPASAAPGSTEVPSTSATP